MRNVDVPHSCRQGRPAWRRICLNFGVFGANDAMCGWCIVVVFSFPLNQAKHMSIGQILFLFVCIAVLHYWNEQPLVVGRCALSFKRRRGAMLPHPHIIVTPVPKNFILASLWNQLHHVHNLFVHFVPLHNKVMTLSLAKCYATLWLDPAIQ